MNHELGLSVRDGLYRIIDPADLDGWDERIILAFQNLLAELRALGLIGWEACWIDSGRLEEGQSGVVMCEPGTEEALEMPANIVFP